ncbi:MAG TPA: hypothetical protein VFQ88_10425 [Nevskiaceae bacterium]|nr:hypothetical protein [Nevskiaceae bacterium]
MKAFLRTTLTLAPLTVVLYALHAAAAAAAVGAAAFWFLGIFIVMVATLMSSPTRRTRLTQKTLAPDAPPLSAAEGRAAIRPFRHTAAIVKPQVGSICRQRGAR